MAEVALLALGTYEEVGPALLTVLEPPQPIDLQIAAAEGFVRLNGKTRAMLQLRVIAVLVQKLRLSFWRCF